MYLDLKCLEWQNVTKNARLLKKIKKKKSQGQSQAAGTSTSGLTASFLSQLTASSNNKYLAGLFSPVVNVYDQASLRLTHQIKASESVVNEIGFFRQNDHQIFGCKENGTLDVWDLRQQTDSDSNVSSSQINQVAISFGDFLTDKREFLCADVNADDNLLIVGTNKTIDDSLIYIFDVRFNSRYLHKFCESHSNDVTQVKFNPILRSKFSSASLDGLVCLYDLDQKPDPTEADMKSESKSSSETDDDDEEESNGEEDPDLMEVALNTDSSVKRIGYLSSSNRPGELIDQLYAITFTNDLFVWDLNSFDAVFKKQTKNKNVLSGELINENEELEETYYFDCFYSSLNATPALTVCMGDSNGTIRLYQKDQLVFETVRGEEAGGRSHRDIIRSSYWNGQNLFTTAEDGFLFKWDLKPKSTQVSEEPSTSIKRDRINNKKSKLNKQAKPSVVNSDDEQDSDIEVKKKKKKKINKMAVKSNKNSKIYLVCVISDQRRASNQSSSCLFL